MKITHKAVSAGKQEWRVHAIPTRVLNTTASATAAFQLLQTSCNIESQKFQFTSSQSRMQTQWYDDTLAN